MLSEFCVGTTTQRGSCELGLLALWLGQKGAANLPFGPDNEQTEIGRMEKSLGLLRSSRSAARFGELAIQPTTVRAFELDELGV